MQKTIIELSDLMKKYPKSAAFLLSIMVLNLVYAFGKDIGAWLYHLTH